MRQLPLDHPGVADHRSPMRFLGWLARGQLRSLLYAIFLGVIWMVCQALMPAIIGAAIDHGVAGKDGSALLKYGAIMLVLGIVQAISGILRHRMAVQNWLITAYRVVQLITRQAVRLGATLPKRVATGEVVAIGTSDLNHLGNAMDILARAAGSVAAFIVVAVLLLRTSATLGLVVLIGVPIMLWCLTPILRPLQRRNLAQRQMMGELSNLATDIVVGLRVLRGVGGEKAFHDKYAKESQVVRRAGVEVGRLQSVVDASQVALPGIFVAVVVWLGARLAAEGQISIGELVAFYGYAAFLMLPLRTATEAINKWIRAFVAAGRVCRVLEVEPEIDEPANPASAPAPGADLVDVRSGLRVSAGQLTALVTERPEQAALVVDRLGRYAVGDVRWGDVPLERLSKAVVRERVVVSDTGSTLFSGVLREQLSGGREAASARVENALFVADAADVVEELRHGLDERITERGRSFSGGQRQRMVLARALAADPEILLLVEPTSAVDAHTEARIAKRLASARSGLTTLVTTSSPLVLDVADRVAFMVDGSVVAVGRHRELLHEVPAYRALVTREEEVTTNG